MSEVSHKCEKCEKLFYPKYPQDNIFFCRKCSTQKLFEYGKKVTPEMIEKIKEKYK